MKNKKQHQTRIIIIRNLKDSVLILTGIAFATVGLKGFLLPNGFIDGGVTGISLLTSYLSKISVSLFIFLINIPFIIIAYKQILKVFAVKTLFAILGLSISLSIINLPIITHDKLLISIFGGFFLGAGIGFSIRGGGVIDGTEVLAIYLSRKLSAKIGDVILVINILIFSVAAFLLDIETALYSILIYLVASKTVDFFVEGIEEYIGVTIVSEKSEEIRKAIVESLGRGVTIYKGERGYRKDERENYDINIIFTVVTRLEIPKLKTLIKIIDSSAFIIQQSINDTTGGMIKKRPLNH